MKKNWFLKFRNALENDISNVVKKKTGNDLFDWVNIGFFTLGILFLIFITFYSAIGPSTLLSGFILWFTAFVIIRYTKETYWLKQLAQKQSITSIRPYLRLQKEEGNDDTLLLANEGKGVAVNLEPVYRKKGKETKLLAITAMAAAPNSYTRSFIKKSMGLNLDPENDYTVEIKYEDIEGRRYKVVFRTNMQFNDKFEIVKQ